MKTYPLASPAAQTDEAFNFSEVMARVPRGSFVVINVNDDGAMTHLWVKRFDSIEEARASIAGKPKLAHGRYELIEGTKEP